MYANELTCYDYTDVKVLTAFNLFVYSQIDQID